MNDTKTRPSRMTLTVDAELGRFIQQAKSKSGEKTSSKAIRWALKRALAPVPSALLGFDLIRWAKGLDFISPRERRELYDLTLEMYKQITDPKEG